MSATLWEQEIEPKYHGVALRRVSGEPDDNNCFPNLKTLRDYVERTGEPSGQYQFDMQVGKNADRKGQG